MQQAKVAIAVIRNTLTLLEVGSETVCILMVFSQGMEIGSFVLAAVHLVFFSKLIELSLFPVVALCQVFVCCKKVGCTP